MPALRNTRHEKFAQAIADGKSQTAAYTLAGYRPSRAAPSRLMRNVKVRQRVESILSARAAQERRETERAREKLSLSKADIMRWLLAQHDTAAAAGQHASAIRALELLGKQLGMFIDRKEMRVIRALADLSDEELEALLVESGAPTGESSESVH